MLVVVAVGIIEVVGDAGVGVGVAIVVLPSTHG